MRAAYRALLSGIFLAMVRRVSALTKASAIIVVSILLIFVGFPLFVTIGLYVSGYSDGGLYSAGKECVVNTIGVDQINEEVRKVFAESGWEERLWPNYYVAPKDSCLSQVLRELSESCTWERTQYGGTKALVLRFGCHFNYAWLVIVDPADRIFYKDDKIRRIADNIGVCFDSSKIGN